MINFDQYFNIVKMHQKHLILIRYDYKNSASVLASRITIWPPFSHPDMNDLASDKAWPLTISKGGNPGSHCDKSIHSFPYMGCFLGKWLMQPMAY